MSRQTSGTAIPYIARNGMPIPNILPAPPCDRTPRRREPLMMTGGVMAALDRWCCQHRFAVLAVWAIALAGLAGSCNLLRAEDDIEATGNRQQAARIKGWR